MLDWPRLAVARRSWIGVSLVMMALGLGGCAQATARDGGQSANPPPAPDPARPAPERQPPAAQTAGAARDAASKDAAAKKPRIATSADGTRIAYDVTGAGPALILLHGGGQTRRSWHERGYVDRLSKQFTVIAVDQRGVGDSGKPETLAAYALDRVLEDVLAVADAADAKRFHLWGFGHGATVGRYLAARSDRVISAVLVAATMGPALDGMVHDAIVGMRTKWLPVLEAKQAGTLDLKTLSPGDRTALEGGIAVNAMALGALADYPPLEPDAIKVPTLWLVGAADVNGQENVKLYEGKLAGTSVTLKRLDGLSYSDSFAKSEPVLAAVEPFLAGQVRPS